jgi:hypothetical protein
MQINMYLQLFRFCMLNLLILNIQVIYKAKNITQHHDLISHANQYVPSVISFFHAEPLNIKHTSYI